MRIPRWREKGYWNIPDELRSRALLLDFLKKHLNPASFCAISTATQTINRNTSTTVEFDTEVFAGTGYDTSNDTFTAPYAGKYYFHANVLWYNIATTVDYVSLAFLHNATTHIVSWNNEVADNINTASDFTQQGSIMLELSKNDTVVVKAKYQDVAPVATEQILGHATNHYTQFFGHRI